MKSLFAFTVSMFFCAPFAHAALIPQNGVMDIRNTKCIGTGDPKTRKILSMRKTSFNEVTSLPGGIPLVFNCEPGKCNGAEPGTMSVKDKGTNPDKKLCCVKIKMGRSGPECVGSLVSTDKVAEARDFKPEKSLPELLKEGFKNGDLLPKDMNMNDAKDLNDFMRNPTESPIPPRLRDWACDSFKNPNCLNS